MELNNWMSNLDSSKSLFELTLAGTHDCATQFVQLSKFARCQDRNILDQLNIGIRCLDCRVKPNNDSLDMIHGICTIYSSSGHSAKHMDMADVLNYCYEFLDKNPSEAIILQFKNDDNKNMEECFDIMYHKYIEPYIDRWFLENRAPLLSEVRGKIVLLRRCAIAECDEYNAVNTGIDFSSWVEQDEETPEPLTLDTGTMKFIIQDRFKYNAEDKWKKCIEPFINSMTEFNGEYIINYTSTAGGTNGPHHNAKYINAQLMDSQLRHDKYFGIMYLDFPTPELVNKIVSTNF